MTKKGVPQMLVILPKLRGSSRRKHLGGGAMRQSWRPF